MNLLITLAVTALVGGGAFFVSTVAPDRPAVQNDTQAHVSADAEVSHQTNESASVKENDSFSAKIKGFLDFNSDEEKQEEISTDAHIEAHSDTSVEADSATDVKTETNGSAFIEVNL